MDIESQVPADSMELALNKPFRFSAKGEEFVMQPLSLCGYLEVEKKISLSLLALIYNRLTIDNEAAKAFGMNEATAAILRDTKDIVDIIIFLMDPVDPDRLAKMIKEHNKANRGAKDRQIKDLNGWIRWNLSMDDMVNLLSWVMRYSSEVKKKILQSYQKGIGSATQETNETGLVSTDQFDPWDFLSAGPWKPGMPE